MEACHFAVQCVGHPIRGRAANGDLATEARLRLV
eukprot:CAMPEP_0180700002 /NCGR_PEP_ID=MMETSP1038_2-20121128/4841_1 /TAXON_ID=632150 /ORGANISM="Azadinium spinosum, Strain 3D9" /LENGTH=33 /DNA_ID= /DNA_START= /DNA_END= /DNA_ORIENTATION=